MVLEAATSESEPMTETSIFSAMPGVKRLPRGSWRPIVRVHCPMAHPLPRIKTKRLTKRVFKKAYSRGTGFVEPASAGETGSSFRLKVGLQIHDESLLKNPVIHH
jgi:hypothetical protein